MAKKKEDSTPETQETSPLNIYQKLVKVRQSLGYIKKEAKGYGYSYVKESQVLLAMAEEMNKQNLFLEQRMAEKPEMLPMKIKTKQEYQDILGLSIKFTYIFTNADNPQETIVNDHWIQNAGCDAQAMGSLMTYSMKYFLFKFFNIAMDDFDKEEESLDIDGRKEEKSEIVSAEPLQNTVTPEMLKTAQQLCNLLLNKVDEETKTKALEWCQVKEVKDIPYKKLLEVNNLLSKRAEEQEIKRKTEEMRKVRDGEV